MSSTLGSTLDTPPLCGVRWRVPVSTLVIAVVFLAGTLMLLYPQAASWFSQFNQSKIINEISTEVSHEDSSKISEELLRAKEYNEELVGGGLLAPGSNVPTSDGSVKEDTEYGSLLNVNSEGLIGRLRVPSVDIDLPIYHGTDTETLLKGVGHLQGTALPVGGESWHTVLTAHRGLPEANLFNDLPKVGVGDTFSIEVFNEVLTYRVTETQTVEPDETKSLAPQFGKDLATLVTCTPLGINTHRMLVTGERVHPTPQADLDALGSIPDIPGFPWWSVWLGSAILVLCIWVFVAGRPRANKTPAL
ncbi:class C sortase [Glutamicibacter sp. BW80]|uniref:class C sortase n=1 Tax=Glutamicibacter sp. BW80 TaxID=2024404 RepID=UPI000BB8C557|nr:class C sortase [Glutamicibacter sp. BW80]PCC27448.1 class C sortase [Glutamicibacter sp. BW80]